MYKYTPIKNNRKGKHFFDSFVPFFKILFECLLRLLNSPNLLPDFVLVDNKSLNELI